MIYERQGWRIIIKEPAKSRIENNQCPCCALPKSEWKRRTDWRCCSKKCTIEFFKYYISYGWRDIRRKAFNRDNNTCVKCGKSPEELMKWYKGTKYEHASGFLIGDHIIPIALGGKEFDVNNVQTLCIDCNKIKTKKDMKDIAKQRQLDKILKDGQKVLK